LLLVDNAIYEEKIETRIRENLVLNVGGAFQTSLSETIKYQIKRNQIYEATVPCWSFLV
jgi:hypothetical protein